jgi:serine/threonine protein kinase
MGAAIEIPFADLLAGVTQPLTDAALAELIDADGRRRIRQGLEVSLERYLDAVPDLRARPDALDAAADVCLRSLSRSSRITDDAITRFIERHPDLEQAAHEAAHLSNAMLSTSGLRRVVRDGGGRPLPADFGPFLAAGAARYELRALLGSGAAGDVYLANDRQLAESDHDALVAVKIYTVDNVSPLASIRRSEEATKARRIDHANVVRVLDRGVSPGGEEYIVSEYAAGGDLATRLESAPPPLPARHAASLVSRAARGVQAAHNAGLVHCDLKPGNIMLSASDEPKVADFGVAARFASTGARPGDRASSQPIGNLAFISPEQYRMEEGSLTPPSDVYALGGILYLLLTGELPNGESVHEIRRTHDAASGRQEAPDPRARRPSIDRDLAAICRRAMAPRPAERYAAAASLADDLDAWLRREPIRWTRPSPWRVVSLWARRRPGVVALTAVCVVAIALGTAFGVISRRQAEVLDSQQDVAREFSSRYARDIGALGPARTDTLHLLWSLRYMFANQLLPAAPDPSVLDDAMFDATESIIDDALAAGRGDHVEVLLLRVGHVFNLVAHGRVDGVLPELDHLRRAWARLCTDPDDPFLGAIDAIAACAVVQQIERSAMSSNALSPEDRDRLESALGTLLEQESNLEGVHRSTPLHFLLLECLERALAPGMLDRPAELAAVRDRHERAKVDRSFIGLDPGAETGE